MACKTFGTLAKPRWRCRYHQREPTAHDSSSDVLFEDVCGPKTINDESDDAAASVSDSDDEDLEDMFGESDAE